MRRDRNTVTAMLATCLLATTALSSCDDGNITDELALNLGEGYVVKMTGRPYNTGDWDNDKYQIVIAGFAAQDSYPLLAKKIPEKISTKDYVFEGISPLSETIELCVLNRINKRVATLATIFDKGTDTQHKMTDTLRFDARETDASMYACIQTNIFNKRCIFCHGMGETPAAGLYLTKEESYKNLVGAPSTKVEDMNRVSAGNADESTLYKVLSEYGKDSPWHYDHTKFFYGSTMSNLVKEWINSGAKQ